MADLIAILVLGLQYSLIVLIINLYLRTPLPFAVVTIIFLVLASIGTVGASPHPFRLPGRYDHLFGWSCSGLLYQQKGGRHKVVGGLHWRRVWLPIFCFQKCCPSGRCCFLWVCGPRDTCIPVPFWNDPQAFSFRFECAVWHRLRELCGMISELNNPRTQRAKGRSRAESRALAEGQF